MSEFTSPWLNTYPEGMPLDLSLPTVTAIDQFRETARRSPDSPAVYYFDTIIRFKQIDQLSNSFALALREIGIQKGDRVALFMQNIPQFWIAQLAIWKIGGIVVPLNVMFKAKELIYHVNDSGAKAIVALESLFESVVKDALDSTSIQHVITTSEIDLLDQTLPRPRILESSKKIMNDKAYDFLDLCKRYPEADDPVIPAGLQDVAMLVYTSGTTGNPKGAMNTHANVAFNAETYRTWWNIGSDDVIVGGAPLFHITGLIAYLATAGLTGSPIILCYRFDAEELLRVIEKWRGCFTVLAITAYIALMNHPSIGERDLSSFRKATSGGAPIPYATIERFRKLTGCFIHPIYGLTETTSPSHMVPHNSNPPVDEEYGALSVGLPTFCLSKVVDPDTHEELPIGQIGEIAIKGSCVVAGYWEKPEETAKAIQDGWLFTGDVGRMDQNGWFWVVDRTKDMIIASGFKVWPREVEDVLYQHESIREVAVVGAVDEYRGQTVKAFVSLKSGYEGRVRPEELILYCKERMAAYKYPRQIEIREELPKTATGKLMRRALRDSSNLIS